MRRPSNPNIRQANTFLDRLAMAAEQAEPITPMENPNPAAATKKAARKKAAAKKQAEER